MATRKKKTANLNTQDIDKLAKDKPIVYKILDEKGVNIYTGVAKKGRVTDRIKEHLPGGPDPIQGAKKVRIEQKSSIDEAMQSEESIIKRSKPKYNTKGK
ncbi:hypothetical protein ACFLUA_03420 [Chloroflexota bacterium]